MKEQTPNQSVEEEQPETQEFVLFETPNISKKQAAALKALGVDLESVFTGLSKINEFANLVMKRLSLHEEIFRKLDNQVTDAIKSTVTDTFKQLQVQNPIQPQQQMPQPGGMNIGDLISIAGKVMGGNEDSQNTVLAQKMNTFMTNVIDKAIDNVTNPPKSAFQIYFDEFYSKKAAKKLVDSLDTDIIGE